MRPSELGSRLTGRSKVENIASGRVIFVVVLSVEFNVVPGDRPDKVLLLDDTESLNTCVHVGHVVLHSLLEQSGHLESSLVRDASLSSEPSEILLDFEDAVEENHFIEHSLSLRAISHGVPGSESLLEDPSFGESSGESLDLIGDLIHPDLEEGLTLLHDLLLHELAHRFDLGLLSVVDQVSHNLDSANGLEAWDLSNGAHCQLRHLMSLLLNVLEDVFNNLLHENSVVSLSRHTGVSRWDSVSDDRR